MNRKLGLFRLANRGFAVPLDCLLRVVDSGFCTSLPLTPEGMTGILVLDDEIIPLLDSDWLPGGGVDKGLSTEFKVLVTTEYGPFALPADMTVGIVANNRCAQVSSDQEVVDFFSGSVSYRDNHYQVLNTDVFIMSLIRP